MHTNFHSIAEHRLIFNVEESKPISPDLAQDLTRNFDSLKIKSGTELAQEASKKVASEAKQVADDAKKLGDSPATPAKADAPNDGNAKSAPQSPSNGKVDVGITGGLDSESKDDKGKTTPDVKSENPNNAKIKEFGAKITEILNDPELKSAIAAIAEAVKELLNSIKNNKVEGDSTSGTNNQNAEEPRSRGVVPETTTTTENKDTTTTTEANETIDSREARVKKELESHIAENSENTVDTLIAKKQAEKDERTTNIDQKISALDKQYDALKTEQNAQEDSLQNLELELKRTDDADAKDDLQAKIDMIKADIAANEQKLSIISKEIDEEVAKEDVINDLDKDIEALKALREKAEAAQKGITEGVEAFKKSPEYSRETIKTIVDGLGVEITKTLDVQMTITEDSQAALKKQAESVGLDMFAGIENGKIKDPTAFMDFIAKLLKTEEKKTDATPPAENTDKPSPGATPTAPEDGAKKSEGKDASATEGTPETVENKEKLEAWAKHLQERCDSKEFPKLNGMEVRVESENIVFIGTQEQVNILLKPAAERGMSPNIAKEGDKFKLTTNIVERGNFGYVGKKYDKALVEAQEKNALGKEEQRPATERPNTTTPEPSITSPKFVSVEPGNPRETQENTSLAPAKDAPVGQIRQDTNNNYWQKTNEGWVSYNNQDANMNSDSGFRGTTWSDSTIDEYGVKIIEKPLTEQEKLDQFTRDITQKIDGIINIIQSNQPGMAQSDLDTINKEIASATPEQKIRLMEIGQTFINGPYGQHDVYFDDVQNKFVIEKSLDIPSESSIPSNEPITMNIDTNNLDTKNIA